MSMFSYHEVNLYLDDIELPRPMSEIEEGAHDFKGDELLFLQKVKKHLFDDLDYESYKSKPVYCIGICRLNLTRIGLYILLEDELIFVHASAFKFSEESAKWLVSYYPYREIISLEFNDEDYNYEDFESGVLFIKLKNEKGAVRSKTIRNINPNHFECIREFHEKMQQERYI